MRKLPLLLLALPCLAEQPSLLITGQVAAREAQYFIVPRSDSWQQQIKWLAAEGQVVQPGEPVLIFDAANLQADIRQKEAELRAAEQKAQEENLKRNQELLKAQHELTQAKLAQQKAEVDARVPAEHLSRFQYEQYQFALRKAEHLVQQAELNLRNKEKEVAVEARKQKLDVRRIESDLQHKREQLAGMELKAERAGAVMHGRHPWNGTKLTPGANVQPGWIIAEIPNRDSLQVQAWVHEVDAPKLINNAPVSLRLDANPNLRLQGQIRRIGQQAEKRQNWGDAKYLEIWVELAPDTPLERLTPGMSVLVDMPLNRGEALGAAP
ncbi:HlyD family secretion protein [Permianibacter aggregans]|uniref:HlyD family secretion protein n=1 Tax=Permianibacter aggregans TaxID=1510150 RepID=A0A4R6USD5_9GAMM|nr:HlyD family efflux transporter periplasmic adaptor subunit [Permianibacter aggregans]TDQ46264.1 HlyD family secretion protein [Permianibacter aggregans]